MRLPYLALSFLFVLAACSGQPAGDSSGAPDTPSQPTIAAVEAKPTDEITGLSGPATGVAFWTHSNVAFNGLVIVANADGIASYNIEDGAEVSRINGVNARGAAVSYVGFGPQAAGVLVTINDDTGAFQFYGVDNVSRLFTPLVGGPEVRGVVRGFCFGRAIGANEPSLFVVQKNKLEIFNLAFTVANAASDISVDGQATIETPENLHHCAVDHNGMVLIASDQGEIFQLTDADAFDSPLATADVSETKGLGLLIGMADDEAEPTITGQVALLDGASGALSFVDMADGEPLGVVTIGATDEIEATSSASVIGATYANFGAVYRNGVIAVGVDETEEVGPAVRLVPANGVLNALAIAPGDAIAPRGAIVEDDDDDLLIEVDFEPGQ